MFHPPSPFPKSSGPGSNQPSTACSCCEEWGPGEAGEVAAERQVNTVRSKPYFRTIR
jgi:hypothetical protein